MTQDELLELMTAILDGTASPQEEARLAAHLQSDPEMRRFFEEARVGTRALKAENLVEMPRGLQDQIRHELRHRVHREPARRMGWMEALRARPVLGLLPAFATGAAAGILVFSLLTGSGFPGEDGSRPVYGTMGAVHGVRMDVTLGNVDFGDVEAEAWTDGARVAIHIDVLEENVSPLELVFDGDFLQVESIRWPCVSGGQVEAGWDWATVNPRDVGCCELVLKVTDDAAEPKRMTFSGDQETMELILRAGS